MKFPLQERKSQLFQPKLLKSCNIRIVTLVEDNKSSYAEKHEFESK